MFDALRIDWPPTRKEVAPDELRMWVEARQTLSPKAQMYLIKNGEPFIKAAVAEKPLTEEAWDALIEEENYEIMMEIYKNPSIKLRHLLKIAETYSALARASYYN